MTRRRMMVLVALAAFALGGLAFWRGIRVVNYRELTPSATMSMRLDMSERRLYVTVDGEERSYRVAVGSAKHPTPRGAYAIGRIVWNPSWVPPDREWARGKDAVGPGDPNNPMGRVKMYFREPAYYIHGTPYTGSLGRAVSHGCVRLSDKNAIELARLVMKHGGQPRQPSWFDKILARARSTQQVRLSNPVPLRITR